MSFIWFIRVNENMKQSCAQSDNQNKLISSKSNVSKTEKIGNIFL